MYNHVYRKIMPTVSDPNATDNSKKSMKFNFSTKHIMIHRTTSGRCTSARVAARAICWMQWVHAQLQCCVRVFARSRCMVMIVMVFYWLRESVCATLSRFVYLSRFFWLVCLWPSSASAQTCSFVRGRASVPSPSFSLSQSARREFIWGQGSAFFSSVNHEGKMNPWNWLPPSFWHVPPLCFIVYFGWTCSSSLSCQENFKSFKDTASESEFLPPPRLESEWK